MTGRKSAVDHIIPQALGGPTEEGNLWLACSLCNASKGAR
ncbi:MAG: HNH endonuclease [Chloroflexota bacterium]